MSSPLDDLRRRARAAQQQAQPAQALALWRELAAAQPADAEAWDGIGQCCLQAGDLPQALDALTRAAEARPTPAAWTLVALCHQRLADDGGEERALQRALQADASDLMALLMRAKLHERRGQRHDAVRSYGAAATVAPPLEQLPPALRPAVAYARQFHAAYQQDMAAFLDRFLEPRLAAAGGPAEERFRLALDILVGRKQRYDAQPMRFFYPRLAPVEFFPRDTFPWLDAVEAETDAIRDEFLRAQAEDGGAFVPYITYGEDQPLAQWRELNHSPRWSVLHLVKDGAEVPANAARCPRTLAAWRQTPAPVQSGRTPVCLFSLLKPHTAIPPHVGASNVRLVVHLPLIVPAGCRFRVGNSVRTWEPGRAWVFDDTIEHEARNDSAQTRVILIFDTWHPGLTAEERQLISALNEGLEAFGRRDRGYDQ